MTTIIEALELLERALPQAPILARSFRPPITESDLARLRDALAPLEVPPELVTLLQWADGQHDTLPGVDADGGIRWSPSWPAPAPQTGCLFSASGIIFAYGLHRDHNASGIPTPAVLVPFCGEQMQEVSLEIAADRPGVVVDTMYDGPNTIAAPSLAATIAGTADLIESGFRWIRRPGPARTTSGNCDGWRSSGDVTPRKAGGRGGSIRTSIIPRTGPANGTTFRVLCGRPDRRDEPRHGVVISRRRAPN